MEYVCGAHQHLLVFDLETIPATEHTARLTGCIASGVQQRQENLLAHFGLDRNGQPAFPPAAFHQIVAIGFLHARIEKIGDQEWYIIERFGARCASEFGERELLDRFLQYAARLQPRLVSFNGRGFDLSVVRARAMRHGINAEWLYRRGKSGHSYQSRYRSDCHCDLLDTLTDYGASARLKLHEACVALGLPGKPAGIDGATVAELRRNGDNDAIRDYCESDVLNTYLLYLRHMLHRGPLSAENHAECESELAARLEKTVESRPSIARFLQDWQRIGPPSQDQLCA